jgi:hypothetical protein
MKIRPLGAELVGADRWTDGQTDMTKPEVAFLSFFKRACKLQSFFCDERYFYGNDSCILHNDDYKIRRFGDCLGIKVK